jgi:hypothetical protein
MVPGTMESAFFEEKAGFLKKFIPLCKSLLSIGEVFYYTILKSCKISNLYLIEQVDLLLEQHTTAQIY